MYHVKIKEIYRKVIEELSKKFIDWLRYSHGMWTNELYMRVGWKVQRLTKILSWNVNNWALYEGWLKSSKADQDTLMECEQMSFIWGLAEKFKGWPRYSHGMWTNELYMRVGWKVQRLTKILSWNVNNWALYEGWLKSSKADQDTLMKCNQMRFIFQHSPLFDSHTFSIGVAMLRFCWSKTHQQYTWHHHIHFSSTLVYSPFRSEWVSVIYFFFFFYWITAVKSQN